MLVTNKPSKAHCSPYPYQLAAIGCYTYPRAERGAHKFVATGDPLTINY